MPDGTSDEVDAAELTGSSAAWLGERADELDVSEEELLRRLVDAYRTVEESDADADLPTADARADEFDAKIEDVRERVIQVKRETDGKADESHGHPELSEQTRAVAETARRLEDEYESLTGDVEELAERVDAGFENFEEVLTYLRDETDDLNEKATTVATTMLALRESVAALSGTAARRERVERLQAAANRAGVRVADCEECEQEVGIALLTEPNCPFCNAAFEDVEANSGWFGSHTLVTGEPPALEAADSWLGEDDDSWLGDDAALKAMAEQDDATNENAATDSRANENGVSGDSVNGDSVNGSSANGDGANEDDAVTNNRANGEGAEPTETFKNA